MDPRRFWKDCVRSLATEIANAIPQRAGARESIAPGAGVSRLQQIEASVEWEPLARGLSELPVRRIGTLDGSLGFITIRRGDDYDLELGRTRFSWTRNCRRIDAWRTGCDVEASEEGHGALGAGAAVERRAEA